MLFDWLEGHEPDESGDLVGPFEELGEISARLHKHAKGWARPDNFERLPVTASLPTVDRALELTTIPLRP